MLTWGDVLYYVRLFLRWWFVLALAVVLSAGTAWYMTRQQPDVYLSQATLRVGNNFDVAAPTQAQVALSNVLADYYAALAKREVILGPVVETLQLGFPWWIIRDRMMSSRVDRGTNLLEITISDTDPARAAAIANAVGEQLITYTPNAPEKVAAQQAEISRQLAESQSNIQAVETKIAELEDRLASLSSAIDISDVQSQLDALQMTRQRYLDEYANLLDLSNQTSANSLSFFEAARPAEFPLPKKRSLTLAMAGAGGLLMAIVAVLVLDRLDERWRTGNDLQSRTGITSLGDIPAARPTRSGGPATDDNRRQKAVHNAYANMVLAAKSKLPRALLVSSPQTSEARSALAVDLAEIYTRTGHRVLLVHTEPEHPAVAERLGQTPYHGSTPDWQWGQPGGMGSLRSLVRPTKIHNLLVLSGHEAGYEQFSSLVPLVYWPEMLAHLRKSTDVVIFDGPSALAGPDAGLLAPLVDGVMLVLNGRQDSRSAAITARQRLTSEPTTQFLGAIVAAGTPRVRQPDAIAAPARSGFQISVGRKGITITIGEKQSLHRPEDDGARSPEQRLLGAPEPQAMATPAGGSTASDSSLGQQRDAERLTWEDLIALEVGGSAPGAKQPGDGPVDDGSPWEAGSRAIITPPPAEARPPGVPEGAAQPIVVPPGSQRRARIANSRRAARPRGASPRPKVDGL